MIRFGLLLWAIALAMPGLAFKAHPEQPAYLPASRGCSIPRVIHRPTMRWRSRPLGDANNRC